MSSSGQTPQLDPGMARRGLLLFVASSTLFGFMAFSAKLATARLGGAQVAMLRFAIAIVPFLCIPRARRAAFTVQRIDLLIYRGVFGGFAVLLYFLAIAHIPVGEATLLNYTAPVFSGIFAALFIGEPIRPRVVLPLMVTFSGLVVVVSGQGHGIFLGFGPWEALGLCSAVLSGAAVTAIRIARRTETSWSIYASFTLCGLAATAPFAISTWKSPTPSEWLALAGVGVFSIGAQLIMTYAFRWVETLIAGVISQLAVVVSMSLGAVFLGDPVTLSIVIGTTLTIGGVVTVMIVSSRPGTSAFDEAAEQ
ncbi:MAG: DMT family transporter [Acidobacteriota bacterium]